MDIINNLYTNKLAKSNECLVSFRVNTKIIQLYSLCCLCFCSFWLFLFAEFVLSINKKKKMLRQSWMHSHHILLICHAQRQSRSHGQHDHQNGAWYVDQSSKWLPLQLHWCHATADDGYQFRHAPHIAHSVINGSNKYIK